MVMKAAETSRARTLRRLIDVTVVAALATVCLVIAVLMGVGIAIVFRWHALPVFYH